MKEINFPNGGCNFAKEINSVDSSFPYYPLRHIMKAGDSTHTAFYTTLILNKLDESNISLRPENEIVLRLTYEDREKIYVINTTENEIVIKRGEGAIFEYKEERLSEKEQEHLFLLEFRGVPLSRCLKDSMRPSQKHYIDSIIKIYPELLSVEYYNKLIKKKYTNEGSTFKYQKTIKQINKGDFYQLLNKLNLSEYWTPKYKENCNNRPMDGFGVKLECNTGKKYNLVGFSSCEDNPSEFRKVCNELIELANLEDSINLLH